MRLQKSVMGLDGSPTEMGTKQNAPDVVRVKIKQKSNPTKMCVHADVIKLSVNVSHKK